jgi:hypothetical protein
VRNRENTPAARASKEEATMLASTQNWPLPCHRIIDHAAAAAPERNIVSPSVERVLSVDVTFVPLVEKLSLRH